METLNSTDSSNNRPKLTRNVPYEHDQGTPLCSSLSIDKLPRCRALGRIMYHSHEPFLPKLTAFWNLLFDLCT